MSKPIFIPTHKSGFSHPKCYLGHTKGCSPSISGEHSISESVLNKVETENKTIDVVGLAWLPKGKFSSIGKASLVSNILCTKHNSDLSPLDSVASGFIDAIGTIDAELQKASPDSLTFSFDGAILERWILKTVIGLVRSKQIVQKSGDLFVLKEKCVELLCSPVARWPLGWGLYMPLPSEKVHHSSSFELIPRHNPANGELVVVDLKFNGIALTFVMGKPDDPASFGIHRPGGIAFVKEDLRSTVALKWAGRKVGQTVTLPHAGAYAGISPDHVL